LVGGGEMRGKNDWSSLSPFKSNTSTKWADMDRNKMGSMQRDPDIHLTLKRHFISSYFHSLTVCVCVLLFST
jgi:hypothetical protein